MILSKAAALTALVVLAACNAPPPADEAAGAGMESGMAQATAGVQAASDRELAAWNQEDPAAFADMFTDDVTVTLPDTAYHGKEAVLAGWVTPSLPILSDLTVSDRSFDCAAASCTETGNYRYTRALPDQPVATPTGTYRSEWVMEDGAWRLRETTITVDAS